MTLFMPSHRMPQTIKLQGRGSRKTGKQKLNTLLLPTREVIKDSTGASKNCKVTVDQAHRTLDGVCLNWNEQYYLVYQCLSMFIHVYPCLLVTPEPHYATSPKICRSQLSQLQISISHEFSGHSEWAIPQDTHGTHVCLAVYSRRNPSNISNSFQLHVISESHPCDLAMTCYCPARKFSCPQRQVAMLRRLPAWVV